MKLQDLRSFIVLLAGLIALIINMKTGREVTVSLLIVLIVIVVFYFIGTLAVEILQWGIERAAVRNRNSEEEDNENDDDVTDDDEDQVDEESVSEEDL